jgi:hypothetical protein
MKKTRLRDETGGEEKTRGRRLEVGGQKLEVKVGGTARARV